jgi:hypothetical protein
MRAATRLATLIIERKGFFFPIPEHIMTHPGDKGKPGTFLQLYPHPLSRLYTVLMWKIHREQDGDAVILRNTWLKDFANLDHKSLVRCRAYLNDHKIILAAPIGNGWEFLYRVCDANTGQALADETNIECVKRLRDRIRIAGVVRTRVMRRYKKSPPVEGTKEEKEPLSSWNGWQ